MTNPKFSVIIPVYNRPEELEELLSSLSKQNYKDFEVRVFDDGSSLKSEDVVNKYAERLDIFYKDKDNTGQGFTRNEGAKEAKGEYLVFFDSDCVIPPNYFNVVTDYLKNNDLDAWGGPDKADDNFTLFQKAITYALTSFLSTGGIRGGKRHVGKFQPRTFNMGIKKEVFLKVEGFLKTNMGEDIELSSRLVREGFKTDLIHEAYVFHKRRTNLRQFFKQAWSFGKGRTYHYRHNNAELKLVHFFPLIFTLGMLQIIPLLIFNKPLALAGAGLYVTYLFLIFLTSAIQFRNLLVGVVTTFIVLVQFFAYGGGFIEGFTSGKGK